VSQLQYKMCLSCKK